ncbi:MAG: hypothetical protein ACR2LV_10220 [Solirubrobacteraceae bacterium]
MKLHSRSGALGTALVACSMLAAAPAAQAHAHHTKASVHGVMVHVHRADGALTGALSGNRGDLKVIRRQGAAALTEARVLARDSHSSAGRARAARATASVERQFGRDASQLTHAIGSVSPSMQSAVASTISAAMLGQQAAASLIAQILPLISTGAQGPLAGLLAELPAQSTTQATQLAGTLDTGSIACVALGAVQQALTLATQAIGLGLSQAQSVLALAPASVGSELQGVLSGLPSQLGGIETLVKGLVPCSSASGGSVTSGGSSPIGGSTVGALDPSSLISGITGLVQGILGKVLPAVTQGQSAGPVAVPGIVGGLLGNVGGLLSGLLGGAGGLGFGL